MEDRAVRTERELMELLEKARTEIARGYLVLWQFGGQWLPMPQEAPAALERAYRRGLKTVAELAAVIRVTGVDVSRQESAGKRLASISDEELQDQIDELQEIGRAARAHGQRDRRAEDRLMVLVREQALRRVSAA